MDDDLEAGDPKLLTFDGYGAKYTVLYGEIRPVV